VALNLSCIYPWYAGVQSNLYLPEEGPLTNPEICGWQSVCVRAILEKDDLLITRRIYEAGSSPHEPTMQIANVGPIRCFTLPHRLKTYGER
jgi:hypothetical protein